MTRRYFFALDLVKNIEEVTSSCHQCASLRQTPLTRAEQTSEEPPPSIGLSYAADVLKRTRQNILVVRECSTSYTRAVVIPDERKESLRDALLTLCIELRPLDGPPAVVRTDNGPGFASLQGDRVLQQHRVSIELGRVKNLNKNPVAEKAIQELEKELLILDPTGGPISPLRLALAITTLNTRIRASGLSSRELWFQRDQFTNSQLSFDDLTLIQLRHAQRLENHPHSEHSKNPNKPYPDTPNIAVGDIVYLHRDLNKSKARGRYLVSSTEDNWCNIRKFTETQLRSNSYRVKKSDCFKVPFTPSPVTTNPVRGGGSQQSPFPEQVYPTPSLSFGDPPGQYQLDPEDHADPSDYVNPVATSHTRQPAPCPAPSVELPLIDTVENITPAATSTPNTPHRRSNRERKAPGYLKDFVLD